MVEMLESGTQQENKQTPASLDGTPGRLRSDVSIKLQTFQAHKLVGGRRSDRDKGIDAIVGLLEFGRRMKLIWLSAEQDDPYADWSLLVIEELLDKAKQSIQTTQSWIEGELDSMDGLDVGIAETVSPVTVRLQFNNPYGYQAAYLLLDYDKLVRSLLTARHLGLIDRGVCDSKIRSSGGPVRHVFFCATKWRFTGVVRKDVDLMTQNAKKASDFFGVCPNDVFSTERRAKFAPAIKNSSLGQTPKNTVVSVLNGSNETSENDMFVVEGQEQSTP